MSDVSGCPPHIKALDDYGYSPPAPHHVCGQCGISWFKYEEKIESLTAKLKMAEEALEKMNNQSMPELSNDLPIRARELGAMWMYLKVIAQEALIKIRGE